MGDSATIANLLFSPIIENFVLVFFPLNFDYIVLSMRGLYWTFYRHHVSMCTGSAKFVFSYLSIDILHKYMYIYPGYLGMLLFIIIQDVLA